MNKFLSSWGKKERDIEIYGWRRQRAQPCLGNLRALAALELQQDGQRWRSDGGSVVVGGTMWREEAFARANVYATGALSEE